MSNFSSKNKKKADLRDSKSSRHYIPRGYSSENNYRNRYQQRSDNKSNQRPVSKRSTTEDRKSFYRFRNNTSNQQKSRFDKKGNRIHDWSDLREKIGHEVVERAEKRPRFFGQSSYGTKIKNTSIF